MAAAAEETGTKLLCEVKEEGLLELLASLQTSTGFVKDRELLKIPAIDRAFHASKQSLAGRLPVIEFTSSAAWAGKTQLLYLIAATATLRPPSASRGKCGTVVVLDTDCRFDVKRLAQVMLHHLAISAHDEQRHTDPNLYEQQLHHSVENALRQVHLFRPQSYTSLVATVENLQHYLLDSKMYASSSVSLDLILIDSISTFYWPLRVAAEALQEEYGSVALPRDSSFVDALRKVQNTFGCGVVATSWDIGSSRSGNKRQLLQSPGWEAFCTTRCAIGRRDIPQFHADMSVEDALTDAEVRQEVIDRGEFFGSIEKMNRDRADAQDIAIKMAGMSGVFGFRVTGEGVDIITESMGEGNRTTAAPRN